MKKGLLGLATGLLVAGAAFAQADGEIGNYKGDYLKDYTSTGTYKDTVYSKYYTKNVNEDSLVDGGAWRIPVMKNFDKWQTNLDAQYSFAEESDGSLKISFVNQLADGSNDKNYTDCNMEWTGMAEVDGKTPFEDAGDTLLGQIYAYKGEDIAVWVKCKADVTLNLRVDLADGNGRYSNRISPRQDIEAGEYNWYYFSFSDTAMSDGPDVNAVGMLADSWSGAWQGVDNGRYSATTPPLYNRSGNDHAILLDPDLITKIGLTIDDGDQGVKGEEKTLWVSKIVLGGGDENPTSFEGFGEGVAVKEAKELKLKVVKGAIVTEEAVEVYNILGAKIAAGAGTVACPAGLVIVKGVNGGVAKAIVK